MLARIDSVEGIEHVPSQGSVLLMINHIAFIDPIVVLGVLPRNIVPLAKVEVYSYPVIGLFPRLWQVIPVRRDEIDRRAVRQVFEVLEAGEIVLVAPEGTRSPQLQQAKTGIAYLASHSNTPVVPVSIDGTIGFPALRFTARWKKPGARIKFGRPFRYRRECQRNGHDQLRLMTDEAMYILAGMLPEERRGYYHDITKATQDTIDWIEE